jgi:hypothetical protein
MWQQWQCNASCLTVPLLCMTCPLHLELSDIIHKNNISFFTTCQISQNIDRFLQQTSTVCVCVGAHFLRTTDLFTVTLLQSKYIKRILTLFHSSRNFALSQQFSTISICVIRTHMRTCVHKHAQMRADTHAHNQNMSFQKLDENSEHQWKI